MTVLDPGATGRRYRGAARKPARRKKPRASSETISVPEAGARYFGLGRKASYDAAERGEIPTIKIGKLLRVPVRAMERILDAVGKTAAD